jgi:hypothetical protein
MHEKWPKAGPFCSNNLRPFSRKANSQPNRPGQNDERNARSSRGPETGSWEPTRLFKNCVKKFH